MITDSRRLLRSPFIVAATLWITISTGGFGVMYSTDALAAERMEHFDRDPKWDGHNNHSSVPERREITQDFGYSRTRNAGGKSEGEIGGLITPAGEPAYYAKPIAEKTFADKLTASGTLNCTGRHFNMLVCFFNAGTVNEWRTPNTVALRLYGRGDVFYAYVEYMTSRWRAGGDSPRPFPMVKEAESERLTFKGYASRKKHRWSLTYDPEANNGLGAVVATVDEDTAICHLDAGHKQDGAVFNHFGLLNVVKSADTGGEVWFDDVTVNGELESFDNDPGWDQFQNRRTYASEGVRPRFDFGFSKTHHAGGKQAGELGGIVYRGDNRYPERLAYYGDRIGLVNLDKPLRASGKISLRRGVSDSTVLFGFFHSSNSVRVSDSQQHGFPENFVGMAIEGPSRDGFFCYPAYHLRGGGNSAGGDDRPHILPDGSQHDWILEYVPLPDGGGRVTVSLDGKSTQIPITAEDRATGYRFDRLGIVTTWIDGNCQNIFFDDLRYTSSQE